MKEDTNHLEQLEQYYAFEKLNRMVKALPDDVARQIYEIKERCDDFLDLLKTDSAASLHYKPLLIPAQRLLEHPCAIEYLCLKNPLFKELYTGHYIKNHKNFIHMSTLESFLASILMHMYH